jgi:hypothetical protein
MRLPLDVCGHRLHPLPRLSDPGGRVQRLIDALDRVVEEFVILWQHGKRLHRLQ